MTRPIAAGRTKRPRDRKQQIVIAASALFRDRGYHNVSMADVAAEVNITAGALYRHFKSKDELLFRAVMDGLDRTEGAIREAPDVRSYIRASGVLSLERRGLPALWQREARHLSDDRRALLRQRLGDLAAQVDVLVAAERPDLGPADVELLTLSLFASLGSFGLHRITLSKQEFLRVHADVNLRVVHATLGIADAPPDDAPPPGAQRSTVELPRREQLIRHAIELFDDRGFQSVRMDDIGAAAGITGASVYKHFATKEDLLSIALTRGDELLRVSMAAALEQGRDPGDALDLLLRSHTAFALEHSRLIGVLASERSGLPEKERKLSYRSQRDYAGVWTDLLRQRHPTMSADLAKIVVDAVFAVTNSAVRTRSLRRRPDLGDRIIDIDSGLLDYDGTTPTAAVPTPAAAALAEH